jgi:hypothetical protein
MKTTSLLLATAIVLGAGSWALAVDKEKAKDDRKAQSSAAGKKTKARAESAGKQERIALTGSYLKQNVKRNGLITDGANQVVVVDREMIEQSGASDLKQVLAHRGVH